MSNAIMMVNLGEYFSYCMECVAELILQFTLVLRFFLKYDFIANSNHDEFCSATREPLIQSEVGCK